MKNRLVTFLIKLKNWIFVITTTRTVKGPFWYFHVTYILGNTATILERLYQPFGNIYRKWLHDTFDREIIIENTMGIFSVNPKNDSLTKSIASFEYRYHDLLDLPESRDVFIDIGANIGFYSLLAIRKGYKRAFAFEPNPDTFARLKKNIDANTSNDKVKAYQIALSDTQSTASLSAKYIHTGASTLQERQFSKKVAHTVPVQTAVFDDLEDSMPPDKISFIKVDVEGYEFHVLAGMKSTLEAVRRGTPLFIEIDSSNKNAHQTRTLLEELGFACVASLGNKNFLYKKEVVENDAYEKTP